MARRIKERPDPPTLGAYAVAEAIYVLALAIGASATQLVLYM